VPEHVERFVDEVMNLVDDDSDSLKEVVEKSGAGGRPPRVPFTAALVNEAIAHFGALKLTESNRLMVRKLMRDKCVERGVRPSHIARHLDPAVSIFFIPTESRVLSIQIRQTEMSVNRVHDLRSSWHSGRVTDKVTLPEHEE